MKNLTLVAPREEFNPTLKDMARLMILSLFRKANAMRIVLEGDDQTNMKYLMPPGCLEDDEEGSSPSNSHKV